MTIFQLPDPLVRLGRVTSCLESFQSGKPASNRLRDRGSYAECLNCTPEIDLFLWMADHPGQSAFDALNDVLPEISKRELRKNLAGVMSVRKRLRTKSDRLAASVVLVAIQSRL